MKLPRLSRNIGETDRMIRATIGVIMIFAGVYFTTMYGLAAVLPLGTAVLGWSPLYALFNLSTHHADDTP